MRRIRMRIVEYRRMSIPSDKPFQKAVSIRLCAFKAVNGSSAKSRFGQQALDPLSLQTAVFCIRPLKKN